eukprot:1582820-Amphidinium_carterae.1
MQIFDVMSKVPTGIPPFDKAPRFTAVICERMNTAPKDHSRNSRNTSLPSRIMMDCDGTMLAKSTPTGVVIA